MEGYEAYKDSGVEWIGEIPAEWEVKKLKYVAVARPSNIDKKSKNEEEPVSLCNYLDVYKNEFISRELTFMRVTATQEQIEKFLLLKGDILATKDSESPDDIANPALVIEDFDRVVCGYHLTHIKPKKIMGSYLFRYFQTNYLNSYFEVSANGVTRYGLGVDKFDSALILNPSMDEQTAIANFLDRKTAEIDALIAQKECLLELYEEERIAIINHAVTKGLDPNAELKDSGIDWLGEIPVGWEVVKLSYGFQQIGSGTTPTAGDQKYYFNANLPWIVTGDLKDSEVTKPSRFITNEAIDTFSSLKLFPANTLLIAMYGATTGKVGVLKFPAYTNQACCALAEPSLFNERYTFYWFLAFRDLIISNSYGGGQPNISQELIRSLRLHCPPINEQTAIANFLDCRKPRKLTQKSPRPNASSNSRENTEPR